MNARLFTLLPGIPDIPFMFLDANGRHVLFGTVRLSPWIRPRYVVRFFRSGMACLLGLLTDDEVSQLVEEGLMLFASLIPIKFLGRIICHLIHLLQTK